jgi:hypothetical protein
VSGDEVDALTAAGPRLSSRSTDEIAALLRRVATIDPQHITDGEEAFSVRNAGDIRNSLLFSPLGAALRSVGIVVDDEHDISLLEASLARLFAHQARLDIYDAYLLSGLMSRGRNSDAFHTVAWLGGLLTQYGNPRVMRRIDVKGIVPRDCTEPRLRAALDDGRLSMAATEELRGLSDQLARMTGAVVGIDVRLEHAPSGQWFHGRFAVLGNRWVVSSDRGFDFVRRRLRSNGITQTELVRWYPRNLPAGRLASRYEYLTSVVSQPL